MKKRIISLLTAFVLISTVSLFSAFGANAEEAISDDYKNAIDVLTAVYPEIPTGSEGTYTRAEFVAAVTGLMNIPAEVKSANFLDVPDDHMYAERINMAVSMGLVNSQNMFYPDDPITYAQAIKIVVSAIGYDVRAEILGGYPTGYLIAAKEASVGTYLSLSNDSRITYADGAMLLYEMATADILQLRTVGDSVEYEAIAGENILSVYYDIHIFEGLVSANEYTGLESEDDVASEGRIKVQNVEFTGGEFYELIGHNVRLFYRDDSKRTVVWAYPTQNKIQSFDSEYSFNLSGQRLTVSPPEKEEKEIKLSLIPTYSFIYNGKHLVAANYAPYISLDSGKVTVIDNNDDGVYDVIIVKEIQYGFIDKVNVLGKKIYDKYQSGLTIDLSNPDTKYFVYDSDGSSITLDDIGTNVTAGYVMPSDRSLVEIYIYDRAYGGTIAEKNSDSKIKIRDNYYELSAYYRSIKGLEDLNLGTDVICYLGEGDDIIYIEHISSSTRYAYLANAGEQTTGVSKQSFVKLMTPEDGMLVLPLAKKVNVNGTVKEKELAYADILSIQALADKYRAVKFTVNADGELNKIYSAVCIDSISDVFEETGENDRPKAYISNSASDTYTNVKNVEGVLIPYFVVSASSSVIMIPESAADKSNDDKYEILSSASFKADGVYNVIAYDVNDGGIPKFIMVYTDSSLTSVDDYTKSMIVEKKYSTIDKEGNAADCIKGYVNGEYKSLYITAETPAAAKTAIASADPGDLVRIAYNNDDVVTAATHDYDCSAKGAINPANDYDYAGTTGGLPLHFIGGYIYGLSGNYAMIVSKNVISSNTIYPQSSTIINLGRGTTLFCKMNKDRSGNVISAEVYTEPDFSSVETWRNAGSGADYLVARQRFRQAGTNIIYVD